MRLLPLGLAPFCAVILEELVAVVGPAVFGLPLLEFVREALIALITMDAQSAAGLEQPRTTLGDPNVRKNLVSNRPFFEPPRKLEPHARFTGRCRISRGVSLRTKERISVGTSAGTSMCWYARGPRRKIRIHSVIGHGFDRRRRLSTPTLIEDTARWAQLSLPAPSFKRFSYLTCGLAVAWSCQIRCVPACTRS